VIASDTIAAISSAGGRGTRMIVRVGGGGAVAIAGGILQEPVRVANSAQVNRLKLDGGSCPVWVYLFAAPRSYTGEDLVELHVPGNPLLARMVLARLFAAGARQAEAGEFTARAYFSRRMNLTEAEGVAATISASNEQELRAARQLLSGELSRRLRPAMDLVAQTLALVEAGIDFSDQDISFLDQGQMTQRIDESVGMLVELVGQSERFERISHEPRVVLAGRPNAGKSTLLNALAGRERAVVSAVAGTTRDCLSAEVRLERGIVHVSDVAGLEDQKTPGADVHAQVDKQMHEQAIRATETADYVVLVTDVTDARPLLRLEREPDLLVFTKRDLLERVISDGVLVSARSDVGMAVLRSRLNDLVFGSTNVANSLALNARHLRSIAVAQDALGEALEAVPTAGAEVVAMELREALDALGQVLGEVSPDDLLGQIFGSFCIGK
jgi:tRNA modification GTPase